jgi:NAD(P)H-hydrate epimerase
MLKKNNSLPAMKPRRRDAHKGDFGRVGVIAGSLGMSGAACMTAMAAFRAGAGLVTLAVPRSVQPIVASQMFCVMTRGFAETPRKTFALAALDEALEFCDAMNIMAVGPGIGREDETRRFARALYEKIAKPVVFDADALDALAEDKTVLNRFPAGRPTVLTPHPGEMARLAGMSIEEVERDRRGAAARFAKEHSATLVLKGAGTIVAEGEKIYVNTTGNPGMATGGTGDVLTGVIAALMGQGFSAWDAARLGVYIHGLAGDIAAKEKGETSMIATDVLEALPAAFKKYTARRK